MVVYLSRRIKMGINSAVIPGRELTSEPGISRFLVWSYGPSRNDGAISFLGNLPSARGAENHKERAIELFGCFRIKMTDDASTAWEVKLRYESGRRSQIPLDEDF